jgi:hypothetical protein
MSKQVRGKGQAPPEARQASGGRARPESALDAAELLFGNAAAQEGLLGVEPAGDALDAAREVAMPVVGRAVLSLELLPRDSAQVERFLKILDQSHLPLDRREVLADRLRADQAAGEAVRRAVEACVGEDNPAARGALSGALDQLFAALEGGGPAGSAWRMPGGGEVALSAGALDGEIAGRAEALVADLARAVVPEELAGRMSGEVGESVRSLCAAVHLALLLVEEEEGSSLGEPSAPSLAD